MNVLYLLGVKILVVHIQSLVHLWVHMFSVMFQSQTGVTILQLSCKLNQMEVSCGFVSTFFKWPVFPLLYSLYHDKFLLFRFRHLLFFIIIIVIFLSSPFLIIINNYFSVVCLLHHSFIFIFYFFFFVSDLHKYIFSTSSILFSFKYSLQFDVLIFFIILTPFFSLFSLFSL